MRPIFECDVSYSRGNTVLGTWLKHISTSSWHSLADGSRKQYTRALSLCQNKQNNRHVSKWRDYTCTSRCRPGSHSRPAPAGAGLGLIQDRELPPPLLLYLPWSFNTNTHGTATSISKAWPKRRLSNQAYHYLIRNQRH